MILVLMLVVKKFIIDTFYSCIRYIAVKCCRSKWEQDPITKDIDENLASYWESLTGDSQKIWYTSEVYSSKMYGISSVEPDSLE